MDNDRRPSESIEALEVFDCEEAARTERRGTAGTPKPGIQTAGESSGFDVTSSTERRVARLVTRLEWATTALENSTTQFTITSNATAQRLAVWTTVLAAVTGLLFAVSLLLAYVLIAGQYR
jgi:hypothetical protein